MKYTAIFNQIPPERMNGIPSIGINIHTEGTESYEDTLMDIVSGRVADLEVLEYVPDITDNPKAVEVIAELIDKLPDIEVRGSLEKWQAAFLAIEIDQLSYNYDTVQYNQTVEDREAQIANITEDIRNGNTEYLNDFLNALISDSIREGMTDIFGNGAELDDSEGVQTARKAKELLDKLAEYKPLAKIEELEECNYNMIDNVLNNEKPKEEKQTGRISIKEKLAEKRRSSSRTAGEKKKSRKREQRKNRRGRCKKMNTMFTVEESNLICVLAGEGRNEVIEDMERALPYLKDTDMAELSVRVIEKLRDMSDEEFGQLELTEAE